MSAGKSFVRDSVEFRPQFETLRYQNDEDFEASNIRPTYQQTLSNVYDAYYIPKSYDPLNPQPFRADSPYQQLIDTRTVQENILTRYRRPGAPVKQIDANDKKVLCYLTNWSFYRVKEGKFVPELLDSKLCTHIIYSFGSLDPSTLTVKEFDKWADIDNQLYERTVSLSKDVPVLLAIGGWADSSGKTYIIIISYL